MAYSLRNELRTSLGHTQQVTDWLTYVPQGIEAIHAGNPDALIFVSGLSYDCDWSFLDAALPGNSTAWTHLLTTLTANIVFETHIYSWSGFGTYTRDCSVLASFDKAVGYPNRAGRPHVLTEIGLNQDVYPNDQTDALYFACVGQWVMAHQLGWGIWLFGGSYYVRDGKANTPDTFGSTTANFTEYKNQAFLQELRAIRWENKTGESRGVKALTE